MIDAKKYDDEPFIQLIYSFSLDVKTLCLLKFGNVDREGFLPYKFFKTEKQKNIEGDKILNSYCF